MNSIQLELVLLTEQNSYKLLVHGVNNYSKHSLNAQRKLTIQTSGFIGFQSTGYQRYPGYR